MPLTTCRQAAAALACGNASSDTNSEDDSEVDGDYVPGHDGDDDDDDDDDDNDNSDDDEAEQKVRLLSISFVVGFVALAFSVGRRYWSWR